MNAKEIIKKFHARGFCPRYKDRVCESMFNKDLLLDIITDINGSSYLCKNSDLIDPYDIHSFLKEIKEDDGKKINCNHKGYDSAMICNGFGNYELKETVLLLIKCNATIKVRKNNVCYIRICRDSNVKLECGDNSFVDVLIDKSSKINYNDKNENIKVKILK